MGDFAKNYTKVKKEEFDKFIINYKSKSLHESVCRIFDPPIVIYQDYSMGEWPENMVAQICWNESLIGLESYDKNPEPNEYYIKTALYKP